MLSLLIIEWENIWINIQELRVFTCLQEMGDCYNRRETKYFFLLAFFLIYDARKDAHSRASRQVMLWQLAPRFRCAETWDALGGKSFYNSKGCSSVGNPFLSQKVPQCGNPSKTKVFCPFLAPPPAARPCSLLGLVWQGQVGAVEKVCLVSRGVHVGARSFRELQWGLDRLQRGLGRGTVQGWRERAGKEEEQKGGDHRGWKDAEAKSTWTRKSLWWADTAGQRIHHENIHVLPPSASDLLQILLVLGSGTSKAPVPWSGWHSEGVRVWAEAVAGPQSSHEQCQDVCVLCPPGTPEQWLTYISIALSLQTSALADF